MKKVVIEKSWEEVLGNEFEKDYFVKLVDFVEKEYSNKEIFPEMKNIFRAFNETSFEQVKVVILGQDPYHGAGQAEGLCFSVPEGVKMPPSLKNIFKEIKDDIGGEMPENGSLENWARQGVLLLNSTLTVEAGKAGSHQKKGWEEFTDEVIKILNIERENLVFILWGNYAKKKGSFIDRERHLVLEAAHPSPFSAYNGFFGCKHFSKTNDYLKGNGLNVIKWL